jgi:hypothetical protein
MKRINFNYLLLAHRERILFRNKHPVPDMPKTLVFNRVAMVYIRSDALKFYLEEVPVTHLREVLVDLGQNHPKFPFAVFKTDDFTSLCMSLDETLAFCEESLVKKNCFEVRQFIVSSSESVQIIRVFIAGLNVSAQILQNNVHFESNLEDNERFRLGKHSVSGKMILSTSTSSLKQRAMSLYYWISGSFDKKTILKRLMLDFIKFEGKFYFISVKSCVFGQSDNQKTSTLASPNTLSSEERMMFDSRTCKQLNFRRTTVKTDRIQRDKSKMSENNKFPVSLKLEKAEDNEKLKKNENLGRIQRKMTYEKIKENEEIDFVHRGSTFSIRVKDDYKKSSAFALRSLYLTLEENIKKVEKDALSSPDIVNEYEEFLYKTQQGSQSPGAIKLKTLKSFELFSRN